MPQRTIRGAITTENNKESILRDTENMLKSIMTENNIDIQNIVSILFTDRKSVV